MKDTLRVFVDALTVSLLSIMQNILSQAIGITPMTIMSMIDAEVVLNAIDGAPKSTNGNSLDLSAIPLIDTRICKVCQIQNKPSLCTFPELARPAGSFPISDVRYSTHESERHWIHLHYAYS